MLPDGGRETVQPTRDYSQANRSGSRGIMAYYALVSGIYEINHRFKVHRVRHYYIRVHEDGYEEITWEEVVRYVGAGGRADADCPDV